MKAAVAEDGHAPAPVLGQCHIVAQDELENLQIEPAWRCQRFLINGAQATQKRLFLLQSAGMVLRRHPGQFIVVFLLPHAAGQQRVFLQPEGPVFIGQRGKGLFCLVCGG